MSEKRNRISLAQKLDIIEASKKSGFSIENVIKELDKCFHEPASIIVTPGKRKRI